MSKLQPIVTLPDWWIDRCHRWAEDFVAERERMRAEGVHTRSTELARMGIERDPAKIAHSKMDEVAAAMCFGVDPLTQLNWQLIPDDGLDFKTGKLRVDVKGSHFGSEYLIWPQWKNEFFDKAGFDVMVFVQHHAPFRFRLNGWTAKGFFRLHHEVAGYHHKLLRGTWHLHEDRLWDMREILPADPPSQWENIISCWNVDAVTVGRTSTATRE